MRPDYALIMFAKFPENGKVKTRLAKGAGENFATGFYRVCAEYTFSEAVKLKSARFKLFVYCFSESDLKNVAEWAGGEFDVRAQAGENLGERMKNSFKDVFSEEFKKAIIIGTDLPDISAELINTASSKLDVYDFVIGPSCDGGYYLLGMKDFTPELFFNIEWSSSSVLTSTFRKISILKKNYYLLDEKKDVDSVQDLKDWLHHSKDIDHPVYRFLNTYNTML